MITLKDFMETVNYKISEGSDYLWNCYGENSYRLDSWNGENDGYSASIVFDTKTQVVYETTAYDYQHDRAYRMINSDYVKKHNKEGKKCGVNVKQAWDDIDYVDLEVEEDFLEKLKSIVSGKDYDTRVLIPIDMTEVQFALIARAAHEADITVNEFFERALTEYVKENHKLKEQNDTDC